MAARESSGTLGAAAPSAWPPRQSSSPVRAPLLRLSSALQPMGIFPGGRIEHYPWKRDFLPTKEKFVLSCADKWRDFVFTTGKKANQEPGSEGFVQEP